MRMVPRLRLVALLWLAMGSQLVAQEREKSQRVDGARQISLDFRLEGEGILDRPARLMLLNEPLPDGLMRLHQRSGVDLLFSPSRLPRGHLVSCNCQSVTVRKALERLLDGIPWGYSEVGRQVLIEPMDRSVSTARPVAGAARSTT